MLNTNIATASALLTWMFMDMLFTKEKPTFLGAINGMICGLVASPRPPAGSTATAPSGRRDRLVIVWVAWNFLSKVRPFSKVDDALGVVYTHGIAGLAAGCWSGSWRTRG